MSYHSDIIIIGGGASGLMAAIICARNSSHDNPIRITILEHKDRIGKKILATGNGKCNYTNRYMDDTVYRGDVPEFAKSVLNQFSVEDTIQFFKKLGIYPKDKKGYLYPSSEQASSILDVLRMELDHYKVGIECNNHVISVQRKKQGFTVTTDKNIFTSNKVIISTGGCASSDLGSDGSGFDLAKQAGHHITEIVPALTALRSKADYFKTLAGVRVEACIKLYQEDCLLAEEVGELQLTNYGISGIPVFQISRYAAKALKNNKKKKVYTLIDLIPYINDNELHKLMKERMNHCSYKTMEQQLIGLFNKKLVMVLLKLSGIPYDLPSNQLKDRQLSLLLNHIKCFRVDITEPNPFSQAQVTAGGVDTREVNDKTMESKLVKGLYFTGEVLDVDGTCGGYNLQWAWSSGYVAGRHSSLRIEKG